MQRQKQKEHKDYVGLWVELSLYALNISSALAIQLVTSRQISRYLLLNVHQPRTFPFL